MKKTRKMVKILCWNVAGIRACIKKNALDFLEDGKYDIICFQETKAEEHQVKIPEKLRYILIDIGVVLKELRSERG